MNDFKLSLVVPCYNEENNIESTFHSLKTIASKLTKDYEIIFVDNGGTDGQLKIMKDIYQSNKTKVRVVSLSRNFGYQMSISAGLEHSSGDAIVIIDADLQDPPLLIKDFVEKWQKGYDVVYGVRTKRAGSFFLRPLYSIFYKLFAWTSDVPVPRNAGEFGLISREVADKISNMPERVRFVRGMRAWVGFKQIGIPYDRVVRNKGKSKFRFFDSFSLAMDGLLSFSTRILTFVTLLGILTTLFSIFLVAYVLYWRFNSGVAIPGYAALMVTISFFSGVIISMLGLLGAYIERIFLEVKKRPKYIVAETKGFEE